MAIMIKRIPITKVQLGMYISEHTKGLSDIGIKTQGVIRKEDTIKKLLTHQITDIFIDTEKGIDSPFGLPIFENKQLLVPTVSLEEEKEKATIIYDQAAGIAKNLINDVKLKNTINIEPINELAHHMSESVLRNPNALLCLSQIKNKDNYLLEHSINVGVILGVFSKFLGYDQETVNHLITGGILHDLGKINIPDCILNKPAKLTPDEWVIMQSHVNQGVDILEKSENIHPIAKEICKLHHEKLDGSGYPNGYDYNQLTQYSKMASIADIYDALTATRVYKKGRDPFSAIKLLHELAGKHLDRDLVYSFIRCFSVYPIGSTVKLSNNTAGIVISTTINTPDRPIVKEVYCLRKKIRLTPRVRDLSQSQCMIHIQGIINPSTHGFKAADFL